MEMAEAAVETTTTTTTVIVGKNNKRTDAKTKLSKLFWHGGSGYDAWFSCASNQVIKDLNLWFVNVLNYLMVINII